MNHLQNVTNSIFLPHFPALWSRRPEIVIDRDDDDHQQDRRGSATSGHSLSGRKQSAGDTTQPQATHDRQDGQETTRPRRRSSTVADLYPPSPSITNPYPPHHSSAPRASQPPLLPRITSIPSPIAPHPHIDPKTHPGWVEAGGVSTHRTPSTPSLTSGSDTGAYAAADVETDDKLPNSLDLHVQQVLRKTKREKIKMGLKGLWTFLKTPMGIATGIYGILVVFWGAALVLFLLGWIPTSDKWWQDRWVEICSQIVNGLFTITGVGLIPWRVRDSYRESFGCFGWFVWDGLEG